MNKGHKDPYNIDLDAPRLARYKQKTWKNTKTLCIGLIYSLLNGKDWSSIKQNRTPSFFTKHSQLIVSQKLFGRKLEKSYTKSSMARGGGQKKKIQHWSDSSGTILYLRAFQGHSGRSLIDPSFHHRTMSLFRTVSSSTFITSDVQSIYIPSSIQDGYREVKIWAKDRQYSFCLWILWTKNTRILTRSTWEHRVLHSTCMKHGRNIKTRCIGHLLWRKDWSSIKHDRTSSPFTTHSQLLVSRKLLWWNLEKSFTRKQICHLGLLQRFSL